MKKKTVTGIMLDDGAILSLKDLCRICDANMETVVEMIEEGMIRPEGKMPENWQFTFIDFKRVRLAIHLKRDLRVNIPGAALVIELLEELEELRGKNK